MLATDPIVIENFPQYLPSEVELAATAVLLEAKPGLREAFDRAVRLGDDDAASLRRFCWQAKQGGLSGDECAKEAIRLLAKCAQLREQLSLDTIIEAPRFDDAFWRLFVRAVPMTFHGYGRRGQPVVVVRCGQIDVDAMEQLLKLGEEGAVGGVNGATLAFLRCEEYLLRRLSARASREQGHLVDRVILVLDLWGLGLKHWRSMKDFLLATIKQTVILYPETLSSTVVVNVAWTVARLVWPVVRNFIHPVSQKKVRFLDSGKSRDGMLEDMDEAALPEFLGGQSPGVHLGLMLEEDPSGCGAGSPSKGGEPDGAATADSAQVKDKVAESGCLRACS